MKRPARLALIALFATDGLAADADLACDPKSQYSLFHRTPAACMRELNTDRPDQTESPYTVDAGHFQMEFDIVNGSFDDDGTLTTRTWQVLPVNLKAGLTHRMDFQLVLDTYINTRTETDASGVVSDVSGFGDVTTRLKINIWGNDGGKTAFAVLPYVKLPLPKNDLRNGEVEGGVAFPLSITLSEHWGVTVMTEFDWVFITNTYDTAWVNSASFERDLTKHLAMYMELFTAVIEDAPWRAQADVGFMYMIGKNAQLDWGCNFGVTDSAPDFNPFVGFSARF